MGEVGEPQSQNSENPKRNRSLLLLVLVFSLPGGSLQVFLTTLPSETPVK